MRYLLALVLMLNAAAACGGDGDDSPAPAATGGGPAATPAAAATSPATLPVATLVFTSRAGERIELHAEVADEPSERARGLMFRESMAEDAGMIFVYDDDHIGGFYMKDTLIPLSIAFVAADGTIVDIQDMEPETLDTHRPPEPYRHAIEANQGWFQRNGIAPGDRVEIPEGVAPP